MKIRTDFVTNSSSSSFVCFGISEYGVKGEMAQKFAELIDRDSDKELNDPIVEYGGPSDGMSIGVCITTLEKMFPASKISEMRAIAARELSRVFEMEIPVKDVEYIEEGWYNG